MTKVTEANVLSTMVNYPGLEVGVVDLVVLDRLLRATSKKKSSNFFEEKSAPQTKSWLRLCSVFVQDLQWRT